MRGIRIPETKRARALRRSVSESGLDAEASSPRVAKRNGERYGEGPVARAPTFRENACAAYAFPKRSAPAC